MLMKLIEGMMKRMMEIASNCLKYILSKLCACAPSHTFIAIAFRQKSMKNDLENLFGIKMEKHVRIFLGKNLRKYKIIKTR